MVATSFRRSRTLEILFMRTQENSFVQKNKRIIKKVVYAGQI